MLKSVHSSTWLRLRLELEVVATAVLRGAEGDRSVSCSMFHLEYREMSLRQSLWRRKQSAGMKAMRDCGIAGDM